MARGVNKVVLIGVLGNDPEAKFTTNGGQVTNISIATNEQWKDKNTGENKEHTEWHRVVAFGKLAEIMSQWLKKGSQVYIEGKLKTNKYQAQDGTDRWQTQIVADQMQMLGGVQGNQGSQPQQQTQPQAQRSPQQQAHNQPQNKVDDFDDDIPF